MDYEKKYKEALERAKKYHSNEIKQCIRETLEYIFPEIKENEDEKVRKEIIDFVRLRLVGFPQGERFLNWLEKQGESYTKKDVDNAFIEGMAFAKNELEKQGELKPILDVEIPFGAKDSELIESTYFIPKGFHAEIIGDEVHIKQGEQKTFDTDTINKYEGLTDFEKTLADICIGWVGEEIGWKQYIKDNADILLKIAIEKFNSIQDAPFEQNPANKVESKFHEGDWIVDSTGVAHKIERVIENVTNHTFGYDTIDGDYFNDNSDVHLWTIQDAKDGDVLAWDNSKCIALFKNIYDKESFNSHGCVGHCTGVFEPIRSYHDIEGAHPATKEQHALLFKKMKEAGYEWDADKKELKKVEE